MNIVFFHLHEVLRVVKFIETENRMGVARGLGLAAGSAGSDGNEKLLFNGYRVSVREDEKVLELDGGDGSTTI